jgi:hypothetical protein
MVLGSHLNINDKDTEGETGIPIPKLSVEIDIEDGRDFFEDFSDTE